MGDQALSSLSDALSSLQVSSKKPELPPFDKNNIEKWIRRVESAYIRSGITKAVEKFAFIESKFPVDEDPAVDEFLFGTATDENWNAFCAYLKRRYGKTPRQKAAAILEPIQMDGRTPSQYLAKLKQSYGDISLEDVVKEICLRQLPPDLQQTICKQTEKMSATQMMEYADSYYDPNGSRLHRKIPTVSIVEGAQAPPPTYTSAFNDDTSDVNAIRGRQQNFSRGKPRPYAAPRSMSRPPVVTKQHGFNNGNNPTAVRGNDPALCFYHNQFGDRAKRCEVGCARKKSGNGLSPRRM